MSNQSTTPCPNCGHGNRPGAKFCGSCRAPLSVPQSASAAPPAVQNSQPPPQQPGPVYGAPSVPYQQTPPNPQSQSPQQPTASVPPQPAWQPAAPAPQSGPASEFCPSCGQSVDVGSTFCRHCGTGLQNRQVTPNPVAPQAPMPFPAPQMGVGQATITSAPHAASRFRLPSWGWLLLGLLLGLAIAFTVVLWKPEWVNLQPSLATPTVQPAEVVPAETPVPSAEAAPAELPPVPTPEEGTVPTPTPAAP